MQHPMKSMVAVIAMATASIALLACSSTSGFSLSPPDLVPTTTTTAESSPSISA
jgi:hypothetical protein